MSLLASAAAEPSAVFWRVLGGTKAEANEVAAPARSCSRGGRLAPSPSPGPAWIAAFVEKHLPEIRLNGPCPRSVTSSNGDEDGEYLPGHCQGARGHATEFNGWAKAIESGCWGGHADPDSNTGERGERGEREKGHEHHASVDEQPVTARQIRLRENRLAPSEPLASCRPETEQRS